MRHGVRYSVEDGDEQLFVGQDDGRAQRFFLVHLCASVGHALQQFVHLLGLPDARGKRHEGNFRFVRFFGRKVEFGGETADVVTDKVRGPVVFIHHAIHAVLGRAHRATIPIEVSNALLLQLLKQRLLRLSKRIESDEDDATVRQFAALVLPDTLHDVACDHAFVTESPVGQFLA